MSNSDTPRSMRTVTGLSIHALLVPIPVVCFIGTLLTDIVYWQTADMMWSDMSAWLLAIGLLVALFAVIGGIFDFFRSRRARTLSAGWVHGIGSAVVLILEFVNSLVHTRDAYTSVVFLGLILSALSVLILFATAWAGWALVHRHGVGVRVYEEPLQ